MQISIVRMVLFIFPKRVLKITRFTEFTERTLCFAPTSLVDLGKTGCTDLVDLGRIGSDVDSTTGPAFPGLLNSEINSEIPDVQQMGAAHPDLLGPSFSSVFPRFGEQNLPAKHSKDVLKITRFTEFTGKTLCFHWFGRLTQNWVHWFGRLMLNW